MSSSLREIVADRFRGRLKNGEHSENGSACIMEASSVARGIDWTDDPVSIGLPDLRPLNDAHWPSEEARARELITVAEALWDWAEWPADRRAAYAERVVLRTVREILPIALEAVGLPSRSCRTAETLDEALEAVEAVEAEAVEAEAEWEAVAAAVEALVKAVETEAEWEARVAVEAVDALALAAEAIQAAAAEAAAMEPLALSCRILIEEA